MLAHNWILPFDKATCYYQVGDKRTYQKNQAVAWANGDIDKIHFYFMDHALDRMDLSLEPTETWSELMMRRCRQVREKYDILGLGYSGGFDSQTILDYMIMSGIKLDEIHINTFDYIDGVREGYVALEHAKLLKKHIWPDLVIVHHRRDLDYITKSFAQKRDDWVTDAPSTGGVSISCYINHRGMLANFLPSYQNLAQSHKRGIVDGTEKPRLIVQDDQWCMFMPDTAAGFMLGSYYESFYCSNDLPELFVKQHFMFIRWLENQDFDTIEQLQWFVQKLQHYELGDWINEQWNLHVGRTPVAHKIHNHLLKQGIKWLQRGGLNSKMDFHFKTITSGSNSWYDHYRGSLQSFMSNYRSALVDPNDANCYDWKTIWSQVRSIRPVQMKFKPVQGPGDVIPPATLLSRVYVPGSQSIMAEIKRKIRG